MKKLISILVVSALVALLFAFAPSKHTKVEKKATANNNEPIGGFLSEDK